MTLREALGGEMRRVHELVERLLDREDCLIVLIDAERANQLRRRARVVAVPARAGDDDIARTLRGIGDRPSPERRP
jgi:hypothetical protein